MFRLYSNENFPLPVVKELRRLGCDVLTVAESGNAGQAWPDEEVLDFARQQKRILLTLNRRDFLPLHQENPHHPGIVACTVDADFGAQAQRIFTAISEKQEMTGVWVRVNRPG